MIINDKEVNIEDVKGIQKDNFYKRTKKGLMLNDEQRNILLRYGIHYERYSNLGDLLFEIEECLNDDNLSDDVDDLENVSVELSEIYYYNNVNK